MKFIVLGALLIVFPLDSAFSWGEDGHSIVAEIAQRRLNDTARAAVDKVLKHGSLSSVASWADDVKFTTRPETKPWHFVDIPLAEMSYNAAGECKSDAWVIAVLNTLKPQLRCGKDDQTKLDALRFVVHFVGDIHQPLHTVNEATGGNDINVTVKFCGLINPTCTPTPQGVNLHFVWDETLIKSTFYDWGAYVNRLENGWLKGPEAQAVSTDGTNVTDWALETHAQASRVWRSNGTVLDEAYYCASLPIVDRQLGTGGLRLARFLNESYVPGACKP
jgi:nuclease S1